MKRLLAILTVLFCTTMVQADDWTQRGGFWYYSAGTDAYIRTVTPGYWANGCYYPAQYTYTFHHAGAVLPTVDTSNWRAVLLKIAAEKNYREKESQDFAAAVQALGLSGPNYNTNLGSATGSTAYGYSYQNSATFYGDSALNLSAQFQSLARLAENSQNGTKQITSDFADLLAQASEGQKQVAEILARGQVLAQLAKSLDGNKATIQERALSFKTGPSVSQAWQQSASKCVQCHNPQNASGNFVVANYWNLPAEKRLGVLQRLTTNDISKRMPKDHEPLTPGEISAWIQ